MFNKSKLDASIEKTEFFNENQRFFNLKVNVFKNKNNGQLSIVLPKKQISNVPNKINIRLPIGLFKKLKDD